MTKARILIFEDEQIIADLLKEFLIGLAYEVCGISAYAEDAAGLVASERPDLVLMDVSLKGQMSGLDAAEVIRKKYDVPVIYITAHTDDATLRQVEGTSPYGYIQKPFRGGEVRAAIEIAVYRHQMERQLREREESYRVLAENLPAIVYRCDLKGGATHFFNDMLGDLTGFEPGDLSEEKCKGTGCLIIEEDRPRVESAICESIEFGLPYAIEYRIRHRDGAIRYFMERGRPIQDSDGRPSHIDGVIFDVTGDRIAQQHLADAYDELQVRRTFIESILENMTSGLIVTDNDMVITLANPYATSLWNLPGEMLVGRNLREVCPELGKRITEGVLRDEVTVCLKTGEIVIGFNCFVLRNAEQAASGWIIALKDLTEIIRIRREIRVKERLAAMGEVVARVAHEMRNPLFAISAVAQIIGLELELTPSQQKLIDTLLVETNRINNLVEELLDSSKELLLKKKDFDLATSIRETIEKCRHHIDQKGVTVNVDFDRPSLSLRADQDRILQVMLNLLENAIDASPTGGVIELSARERGGMLVVEFSDGGTGVAENEAEKIFELFYTTKKHGTGLGLPICKRIVEAHGGALRLRDNHPAGTTFIVTLPLGDA